jgi:hypothetical protein
MSRTTPLTVSYCLCVTAKMNQTTPTTTKNEIDAQERPGRTWSWSRIYKGVSNLEISDGVGATECASMLDRVTGVVTYADETAC